MRYQSQGLGILEEGGVSMAVGPHGRRVFVTGGGLSAADFATVAYDVGTGAQVWASRYTGIGGNESAEAVAIVASPGGARYSSPAPRPTAT